MKENDNVIAISAVHRIMLISLLILQCVLFIIGNVLLTHFHTIMLPWITYTSMIEPQGQQNHYVYNGLLYCLFWVQHIVMSSIKYKVAWFSMSKHFALYDRYLFNIASSLTLWFIFSHAQPSFEEVFVLPIWLCIPLSLYGVVSLLLSFKELGKAIMIPFKLSDIINSKQLVYQSYARKSDEKLHANGVYKLSRNPMQLGTLLVITFGNGIYTIDRLIFVAIMDIGILIGVYMQEKRMMSLYSDYKSYTERVKNRYIPSFF